MIPSFDLTDQSISHCSCYGYQLNQVGLSSQQEYTCTVTYSIFQLFIQSSKVDYTTGEFKMSSCLSFDLCIAVVHSDSREDSNHCLEKQRLDAIAVDKLLPLPPRVNLKRAVKPALKSDWLKKWAFPPV